MVRRRATTRSRCASKESSTRVCMRSCGNPLRTHSGRHAHERLGALAAPTGVGLHAHEPLRVDDRALLGQAHAATAGQDAAPLASGAPSREPVGEGGQHGAFQRLGERDTLAAALARRQPGELVARSQHLARRALQELADLGVHATSLLEALERDHSVEHVGLRGQMVARAAAPEGVALGQQRRGQRHALAVAEPRALDQQPREARRRRQPGHRAPGRGHGAVPQRSEELEQLQRALHRRARRRLVPAEGQRVALAPHGELEQRRGQVHAPDLRLVLGGQRALAPLGPQAQAQARLGAPRAARALVGGRARDPVELEPVQPDRGVVAQDARQAAVDHRGDALHGDRGLRDVGGEHHLAPPTPQERRVLALRRQVAVELDDVEVAPARERPRARPPCGGSPPRRAGRPARRPPCARAPRRRRARCAPAAARPPRARASASRPGAADPRCATTGASPRKAASGLGRERRRHHDELQLRPRLALQLAHHGQRQVGVEAALVELVEDDHADALEERVGLQHAHEQPLGDDQDPRRSRPRAGRSAPGSRPRRRAPPRAPARCAAPPPAPPAAAARASRPAPSPASPASSSAGGTRVVLPAPVGATSTADPP